MKKHNENTLVLLALTSAFIDEKTTENNDFLLSIRKNNKLYFKLPFTSENATLDDCTFIQLFAESRGFEVEFSRL